jgi:hypothetical protein
MINDFYHMGKAATAKYIRMARTDEVKKPELFPEAGLRGEPFMVSFLVEYSYTFT